jgi:copper chaperone
MLRSTTSAPQAEGEVEMRDLQSTRYRVLGMTCAHCRRAVSESVGALEEVSEVAVDLESGSLEVHGRVDERAVAAAVEEAGYELAGAGRGEGQ